MKKFDETESFESFSLNQDLFKAIQEMGYSKPTPVQNAVIPSALEGKDITAKAPTGSGKTAAFGLPSLNLISQSPKHQMLILAPTRELALQVCGEMEKFSKYLKITPNAIYGGEPMGKQLKQLRKDNRIIVGTPGRLLDLFRSKYLTDFNPSIVVLDEGDEMLNMGFFEDIQAIFSFLPKKRQTLLFSATLSPKIQKISKKFLKDPLLIDLSTNEKEHKDIHQIYYLIPNRKRKQALVQTLQFHLPKKAIVFCNTKKEVEELSSDLTALGFPIVSIQGDMSQKERQNSINKFRTASDKILVATDVAARGIDVSDISYVFNYDLPYSSDSFTHRVGRTGRMGNKGTAITLVSLNQKYLIKKILLKKVSEIDFTSLPTKDELKSVLEKRFADQLKKEPLHKDAEKLLIALKKGQSLDEIAKCLISKHLQKQSYFEFDECLIDSSADKRQRAPRNRKRAFFRKR